MSTEEQEVKTPQENNVDVEKIVSERVAAALADFKSKLDAAYAKRDESAKELELYKQKERDAEIALLKEQGKLKEAHEKELEDLKAHNAVLEQKNLSLTRDGMIKSALSGFETRNAKAANVAKDEIANELIRDESGNWVHKHGKSIDEFVAEFAANPDNAFLFKPKVNNGGGGGQESQNKGDQTKGKSLFALTQEEVIKIAQEGKLKRK